MTKLHRQGDEPVTHKEQALQDIMAQSINVISDTTALSQAFTAAATTAQERTWARMFAATVHSFNLAIEGSVECLCDEDSPYRKEYPNAVAGSWQPSWRRARADDSDSPVARP